MSLLLALLPPVLLLLLLLLLLRGWILLHIIISIHLGQALLRSSSMHHWSRSGNRTDPHSVLRLLNGMP